MLGYIILSKNLFPFPNILDQMVYTVKYCCGQQLAIEAPVDADLVSTVPESLHLLLLVMQQNVGFHTWRCYVKTGM